MVGSVPMKGLRSVSGDPLVNGHQRPLVDRVRLQRCCVVEPAIFGDQLYGQCPQVGVGVLGAPPQERRVRSATRDAAVGPEAPSCASTQSGLAGALGATIVTAARLAERR